MDTISVLEVNERLAKGEPLNLVDVREPAEHTEFNIGGVLVPLGRIRQMQVDELEDMKQKELICYCRSGNRSGQACQMLDMLGFTNIKNLEGGMIAWKEKIMK